MTDEKPQTADDPCKTFETVYNEYLRQLGEIGDETTKRILEAQKAYAEGAAKHLEDAQKAHEAAGLAYVDAVRGVWEESQRRYSGAYTDYLGAYRDAWVKTEVPDLAPHVTAMVAHSAIAAANYASTTIGNWSTIAWAGVHPSALAPPEKTD